MHGLRRSRHAWTAATAPAAACLPRLLRVISTTTVPRMPCEQARHDQDRDDDPYKPAPAGPGG
jgi:hypothetical protein